jgi:hypothetical protein
VIWIMWCLNSDLYTMMRADGRFDELDLSMILWFDLLISCILFVVDLLWVCFDFLIRKLYLIYGWPGIVLCYMISESENCIGFVVESTIVKPSGTWSCSTNGRGRIQSTLKQ